MKYRINKGLISENLDGKTVIFDGEESLLYTLNETASYIFAKLKKGTEKEKILALLVKKYGIDKKRAEKDINELISALKKKKIISS